MIHMNLRNKFLAVATSIFIVLGVFLILFIKTSLTNDLSRELQKRGITIAKHLAETSSNPILTENIVATRLLVIDTLKNEENIEYIYIIDQNNQITAHTLGKTFPAALTGVNQLSTGRQTRILPIMTEKGLVYDIAAPILKGELGAVHVGMSAAAIRKSVADITGFAVWIIVIITVVGCLGISLMTIFITRPLAQLEQGAEALGNGSLRQHIPVAGNDEIGRLAEAFNRMVDNLQRTTVSRDYVEDLNKKLESTVAERTRELSLANLQLKKEVAERRTAEEQVRVLNGELEQRVQERTAQLETSNKELESFCYSVSHDLRAPLRHINGFCQILDEDFKESLNDDAKAFLARIRKSSRHMGALIDDLLELSRVSRSEMYRENLNLTNMARAIVAQLSENEPARRVSVTIGEGLKADGDPRLLRLLLENLIGNAWKYTSKKENSRIEFNREPTARGMAFFIRDNGIGFDMTYVDTLFSPFQRLVRQDEYEGTGVGLATVQRVVDRHGGQVWAEGKEEAGATFYFIL